MTYSLDFRKRVLSYGERKGLSVRELADHFELSARSISYWRRSLAPKSSRERPWISIDPEAVLRDVKADKDAFYYERAARFGVPESGIRAAMKRLGLSHKKNTRTFSR